MPNAIGLLVIGWFSLSTLFKENNRTLVVIGTLLLTNGLAHLISTVVTVEYSPGVVTGTACFMPLALVVYRNILPRLSGATERRLGVGLLAMLLLALLRRTFENAQL